LKNIVLWKGLTKLILLMLGICIVVACGSAGTPVSMPQDDGASDRAIDDGANNPTETPVSMPPIIEHPRPELAVVASDVFEDGGCSPEKNGWRYCVVDSFLWQVGCEAIQQPDDLLGGLKPAYPMMECSVLVEAELYERGCMFPKGIAYVIFRNGGFELLTSESDLREVFAPIESSDEALSYALAATGLEAYFKADDFRFLQQYADQFHCFQYSVEALEGTHVVAAEQGYQVNLFYSELCGCEQHPTFSVPVFVDSNGNIERQPMIHLYEFAVDSPVTICID